MDNARKTYVFKNPARAHVIHTVGLERNKPALYLVLDKTGTIVKQTEDPEYAAATAALIHAAT